MKKLYYTLAALASFQMSLNAQVYSTAILDGNNVEANVNNGGIFFNDVVNQSPGFEYPKGSEKHLIYANTFWFGTEDNSGNKKLAAQLYNWGGDFFPGPLVPFAATANIEPGFVSKIHQVTKSEIQDHIDNYADPSYVIPSSIANWPAHGDVSQGFDFYLAPFVDVNNDGMYFPEEGDYPLIRGDFATYMILNDKKDVHASGGDPLGVECHFMFYQYNTTDYLNNTVFLNIKVINRSAIDYPEFKVGCFLDPDIGNSTDDAVGCDTNQRVMYAYNFPNNDDIYGANPPAIGVVNLNQSMDVFGYFSDDIAEMTLPNTASDFHGFLDGNWKDGTPFTLGGNGYGGNTNTKYLFSGNPNVPGEWSEVEAGLLPSESRMFMVSNIGPLLNQEEICLDYAFVVGDGGDHLENVNHLLSIAAEVQNFYNSQDDLVCAYFGETLGMDAHEIKSPTVYPNPSNGQITIDFTGEYSVEIHALDGRKVFESAKMQDTNTIYPTIESGSYMLSVIQNGNRHSKTIVVR